MSLCKDCVWNTGKTCEKHIFAYPVQDICASHIKSAGNLAKAKTVVEIFSSTEPAKCIFYADLP